MIGFKSLFSLLLVASPTFVVHAAPNMLEARDSKVQCGPNSPQLPSAGMISTDKDAAGKAVRSCCATIANKWLSPGDPYLCDVSQAGSAQPITFSMHIIKGGWKVPAKFCEDEMSKIVGGCTIRGKAQSWGGCATTEDGNVVSCIFP